jgi:hypothetical protein
MEREQAFQLARTLDQRGFEQHLISRDGRWQISVRRAWTAISSQT